jgi:hypothetical protein
MKCQHKLAQKYQRKMFEENKAEKKCVLVYVKNE